MLLHEIVYSVHYVSPIWCRYWPLVLSIALQVKKKKAIRAPMVILPLAISIASSEHRRVDQIWKLV